MDLATTAMSSDGIVPLDAVLRTEELQRRLSRPIDYEKENRALAALMHALSDSPRTILQTLSDLILELFDAGSAGVSLLTTEDGGKRFYWPAIAGVWKPHIGGGTPRTFGPCGDVLDQDRPLLFTHFERRYPYLAGVMPQVEECLLVPFYLHGKAVGTIWAMAHDDRRRFDGEDLRLLQSLSRFASAAYQALMSLKELDSQRAMLNLMEDAMRAKEALRQSHEQLRASTEELTIFNRVAVGRELRMIELKREINELCERLGEPCRYTVEWDGQADANRAGER
jgi:GAF domain-containing protein